MVDPSVVADNNNKKLLVELKAIHERYNDAKQEQTVLVAFYKCGMITKEDFVELIKEFKIV